MPEDQRIPASDAPDGATNEQPEAKPAWEKPAIRASGTFEKQALACAPSQQSQGFPPCLGGTS